MEEISATWDSRQAKGKIIWKEENPQQIYKWIWEIHRRLMQAKTRRGLCVVVQLELIPYQTWIDSLTVFSSSVSLKTTCWNIWWKYHDKVKMEKQMKISLVNCDLDYSQEFFFFFLYWYSQWKREITWQGQSGEREAFARARESSNPSADPFPHFQPADRRYCIHTIEGKQR